MHKNKKIFILSNHRFLNGSSVNLLDFQQYLKDVEGYNVTYICDEKIINRDLIKLTHRNYNFDRLDNIKDVTLIKGCLITDFKTLCSSFINKKRIVADKCVIIDNIELSFYLNGWSNNHLYFNIDIYECLNYHKLKDVIFLMPPSNKILWDKKYNDLKSYVFYKKIHLNLLRKIKTFNNGKLFFRSFNFYNVSDVVDYVDISNVIKEKYPNSVELSVNENKDIFNFDGYIYNKKPEVYYYEQFGRLIFEYILLNKKIYWFDNPYEYNDGLKDYLNYYSENKEQVEYMMSNKYEEKFWE
jgi:hypothetical protein